MKKCSGDHYNISCPHCGKINHFITQCTLFAFSRVTCFEKPCAHCRKTIYCHARYEIIVDAFSENPVTFLHPQSQAEKYLTDRFNSSTVKE